MRANPAFRRAVNGLLHPINIGGVILLLVNDHWLRWQHPSWLTGKLGDFTWLLFAPFIAALCFAWVVPRRLRGQERMVGVLSFASVGLWFALAKTVPLAHHLTTEAWEAIIGWQGTLRMDATDLLTLPALLVGWWVWERAGTQPLSLRPLGYVAFGLGLFGTLASDTPVYSYTDSGVTKICQIGSALVTAVETTPLLQYIQSDDPDEYNNPESPGSYNVTRRYNVFTSADGGLTWDVRTEEAYETPANAVCASGTTAVDPNNADIQYRWTPGERVERSTDGGLTWTTERELIEMQQDARLYYNHYSDTDDYGGYVQTYLPSPTSGIVDAESGNLVLAMSWDGVLVRTADGEWQWRPVGTYALADLRGVDKLPAMLFFELWLAGALALLVVTTSHLYIRQREVKWLRKGLLIIGWLGWIIITLALPAGSLGQNTTDIDLVMVLGLVSLALLVFIALPFSVAAVWDITRNFRRMWGHIALVAVGAAALYLLPFLLWTQGTIPRRSTAALFALMLAWAGLSAGYLYLRERLPVAEAKNLTPSPSPLNGEGN